MCQKGFSDEERVQNFLAGNTTAVEELVIRYESRVFNIAFLPSSDVELAEEILIEAFTELYVCLQANEQPWNVHEFLISETLEAFERISGSRDWSINPSALEEQLKIGSTEEDTAIFSLGSLVVRLPLDYRIVFILKDVEQLPRESVSRITGLTNYEVRHKLRRSRSMLARWMRKSTVPGNISSSNGEVRTFPTVLPID